MTPSYRKNQGKWGRVGGLLAEDTQNIPRRITIPGRDIGWVPTNLLPNFPPPVYMAVIKVFISSTMR